MRSGTFQSKSCIMNVLRLMLANCKFLQKHFVTDDVSTFYLTSVAAG